MVLAVNDCWEKITGVGRAGAAFEALTSSPLKKDIDWNGSTRLLEQLADCLLLSFNSNVTHIAET